jgi:hypothetical protein
LGHFFAMYIFGFVSVTLLGFTQGVPLKSPQLDKRLNNGIGYACIGSDQHVVFRNLLKHTV